MVVQLSLHVFESVSLQPLYLILSLKVEEEGRLQVSITLIGSRLLFKVAVPFDTLVAAQIRKSTTWAIAAALEFGVMSVPPGD